MASTEAVDLRS